MRAHRFRAGCAVAATALLLAACGSAGTSSGPTWRPKPSFQGEGNPPGNQQPGQPAPVPTAPAGTPSQPANKPGDANVVAARLNSPTGIAILPDNTALVGERATGRIVRVYPQPRRPVHTVRTIPGISTVGGGGLLDLALSPNYDEDNLIFAYITTHTDNRVVAFTLKGPITTVLKGIPRGHRDNTGRLAFRPDGSLLVGTGDAGHPLQAADPGSLAGKVLRVSDIGRAAAGNPTKHSRVYASGFRETDGLCVDADTNIAFQTEALGSATPDDPINVVEAGGAYSWPAGVPAEQAPLTTLPETSRAPGGCAVLGQVLYVTSRGGHAMLAADLKPGRNGALALGRFAPSLRGKYGRLRTVVAAPDGALWITTSNRDGHGHPVRADERVLRIVPSASGGGHDPT
ncbi:MAG TPA: PQQ-dependent sugar dehydrogenase [Jatrophihabitantaceae bacterium]|nr:PQQ-dependent sugar dehydrogenase [Jatrophihabitantaceae bacterium]